MAPTGLPLLAISAVLLAVAGYLLFYSSNRNKLAVHNESQPAEVRVETEQHFPEHRAGSLIRQVYNSQQRSDEEWKSLIRDIREHQIYLDHESLSLVGYGIHNLDSLALTARSNEMVNSSLQFISRVIPAPDNVDWFLSSVPYESLTPENIELYVQRLLLSESPDPAGMQTINKPTLSLSGRHLTTDRFCYRECQLLNGFTLIAQISRH
ncbi:hypothetical protein [Parendozoicomonas haliclonae]|uniref:Uncharacterized protein n=1 Tax=Parendozoicomonas haliclonae TaxID=1960125 RepID=A0A1X7AL63_9GAMM|nr:hypothetical protein [Parendozoicomonas haliclonae]SMA47874.1 hypothetical protein EHSB41UT_02580 [Parendozoicomonas haliclonae]